jgi:hypothetical protein
VKPSVPAVFAALLVTASGAATTSAAADAGDPLAAQLAEIAATLDPRVPGALDRIDGTGRRLLALRSYLRNQARLAERWSWTAQQIDAYAASEEHRALQREIDAVRTAFGAANPGFELWVNPQVRSLDIQIANWNRNESVAAAANALLAVARELPAVPAGAASAALEGLLRSHVPSPTPTIAAPGLSPHGQMRAVDFQVHREGAVIAGPNTATIATDWDEAGWTARLEAAVRRGSARFVGPLQLPREPWHYTYVPETMAER